MSGTEGEAKAKTEAMPSSSKKDDAEGTPLLQQREDTDVTMEDGSEKAADKGQGSKESPEAAGATESAEAAGAKELPKTEGAAAADEGSALPEAVLDHRKQPLNAPEIRSLTADDPGMVEREREFQLRMGSQGSPWRGEGAGPRPGMDFEPAPRTLQTEDPTVAARKAQYNARRDAKRKARQAAIETTTNNFLSLVPETEEDVQYRFTFRVMSEPPHANTIVQSVCKCQVAQSLPKQLLEREDEDEERRRPPVEAEAADAGIDEQEPMPDTRRDHRPGSHRCLSIVESPLVAHGPGKRKLAKLVFHPMAFTQDVPKCANHQETLSTTVVFLLMVDRGNLPEQLEALGQCVERMRQRGKAKLRPVRAVILCSEGSKGQAMDADGGDDAGSDQWAELLSEFEGEHGELWKFGPLPFEDGNALHNVFSDIASVRIAKAQLELENVNEEEPCRPEDDEKEDDEDQTTAEDQMLDEDRPRNLSCNGSECSEGWQRPPVFETEIEGSEVSEGAVELHARMFGLEEGTPTS